jgi:hypothetical protein
MTLRLVLAWLALATVTGCGGTQMATQDASATVPQQAASSSASPTSGPLVPNVPARPAPQPPIDLSKPGTFQTETCGAWPPSGPPTVRDYLDLTRPGDPDYRTAAIVSIDSTGPAFYNTPDRARWTTAWLNAGHAADIYRPFTFTVQRPLTPGLNQGQQVTGYVEGGTVGQDDVQVCMGQPSVDDPSVGSQAVVIFGGNMKDLPSGPVVTLFDVIKGGKVIGLLGREEPIP